MKNRRLSLPSYDYVFYRLQVHMHTHMHTNGKCSLVWYMCPKRFLENWLDLQWSSIEKSQTASEVSFSCRAPSFCLYSFFLFSASLKACSREAFYRLRLLQYLAPSIYFSLSSIFWLIPWAGAARFACEWKKQVLNRVSEVMNYLTPKHFWSCHSAEASDAWHWCWSLQFDL